MVHRICILLIKMKRKYDYQSCLPLLTNVSIPAVSCQYFEHYVSIPAVSCQYFEHFVSIKDEYNIIGNSGLVNHSFI